MCVLSTTSCFAPRVSDSLEKVACLCQKYNVPHLVNNAYGLQSTRLMHSIQDASRYVLCTISNDLYFDKLRFCGFYDLFVFIILEKGGLMYLFKALIKTF